MAPVTSPNDRIAQLSETIARTPVAAVVTQLAEILGARVVAVIGHSSDTATIRRWASGTEGPAAEPALRIALLLVLIIAEYQSPDVASTWFLGANSLLNDYSPMLLLRDAPTDAIRKPIIGAARAFALP